MKIMFSKKIFYMLLVVLMCSSCGFFKGKGEVREQVNMTLEELSHYDGQEGRPTYVAIDGVIYDLTKCRYWKNGEHEPSFGKAFAGQDLTEVLKGTPHGMSRVKRYPIVGAIVEVMPLEGGGTATQTEE